MAVDEPTRQLLNRTSSADKDSFVGVLEELEGIIVDWSKKYVDDMVNALSKGGRPFGMEKKSRKEMLQDYMHLHGNVDAWRAFIRDRLVQALSDVDQSNLEDAQARHLANVVFLWVLQYGSDMGKLLARQQQEGEQEEER